MKEQPAVKLTLARELIERGRLVEARAVLCELVADGVPEAIYLSSMFGVSGESDHDFELRSAAQLLQAAELGYPPAMYAAATNYEFGDLFNEDAAQAWRWYLHAAEANHPTATCRVGEALAFGELGVAKNVEKAREFLRVAVDLGSGQAKELLAALDAPQNGPRG